MANVDESLDRVSKLLSDATALLAECAVSAEPNRRRQCAEIARPLMLATLRISQQSPPASVFEVDESEDERIERKSLETARRVEELLLTLGLSPDEQRFSKELGEQLVDVATNAYLFALQQTKKPLQGACITAAATIALMIVHEEPD